MTDLIIFGVLFAVYMVLRPNTFGGPSSEELFSLPTALADTLVLLTSSFTCGLATLAAQRGKVNQTIAWLVATFVLGATFLTLELAEFSRFVAARQWSAEKCVPFVVLYARRHARPPYCRGAALDRRRDRSAEASRPHAARHLKAHALHHFLALPGHCLDIHFHGGISFRNYYEHESNVEVIYHRFRVFDRADAYRRRHLCGCISVRGIRCCLVRFLSAFSLRSPSFSLSFSLIFFYAPRRRVGVALAIRRLCCLRSASFLSWSSVQFGS